MSLPTDSSEAAGLVREMLAHHDVRVPEDFVFLVAIGLTAFKVGTETITVQRSSKFNKRTCGFDGRVSATIGRLRVDADYVSKPLMELL